MSFKFVISLCMSTLAYGDLIGDSGFSVYKNLSGRSILPVTGIPGLRRNTELSRILDKSTTGSLFQFFEYCPPKLGVCYAGKTYNITSEQQLKDLKDEYECVWAASKAPDRVPQGFLKGFVLSFLNSEITNSKMQSLWQGKQAQTTQCSSSDTTFKYATNMLSNEFHGPALSHTLPCLLYLGRPSDRFASGEYLPRSETSLFCDYTVDWADICKWRAGQSGAADFSSWNTNGFASASYDMLRVVGRTDDGAWILLGRSIIRDIYAEENGAMTASWWYVLSYDEKAFDSFDNIIGPFNESFEYRHGGSADYIKRVTPFYAAASDPIVTFEKFAFEHFLRPTGHKAAYGLSRAGAIRGRAGIAED